MLEPGLALRDCREADLPRIQAIYAHHVLTGTGSFETTPPDLTEIRARFEKIAGQSRPFIIAEQNGEVLGYAYADLFRPRQAYSKTLEDSVYVAPEACGHGIGAALLAELLARAKAQGYREMLAVIGDSENHASIALHRKLGFRDAGRFENVGYKFDRWLDIVLMQRAI